MKEKNRHSLRHALDRLPEHTPPAHLWRNLERDLTPGLAERLPSYQPPPSVWNGLSEELARPQVPSEGGKEQSLATVRRLPVKWLAIAASLLFLVGLGYGWGPSDSGPDISYAHTQEVAPAGAEPDWDWEEGNFTDVLDQLATVDEPELNTLRMELTELTEAKQEVKAMLVAYGEDPTVVRQLAEIERDRSDVYRRIIVRL